MRGTKIIPKNTGTPLGKIYRTVPEEKKITDNSLFFQNCPERPSPHRRRPPTPTAGLLFPPCPRTPKGRAQTPVSRRWQLTGRRKDTGRKEGDRTTTTEQPATKRSKRPENSPPGLDSDHPETTSTIASTASKGKQKSSHPFAKERKSKQLHTASPESLPSPTTTPSPDLPRERRNPTTIAEDATGRISNPRGLKPRLLLYLVARKGPEGSSADLPALRSPTGRRRKGRSGGSRRRKALASYRLLSPVARGRLARLGRMALRSNHLLALLPSPQEAPPQPRLLVPSRSSASATSAMDDAACCKSGGGADTPDKLSRSCSPEIYRRNCSDACLLEAKPREELSSVDGGACCKGAAGDTPDQMSRCFRCHRLQHVTCSPEVDYNCCDACLHVANSRQEQVPSWVRDLADVDISELRRKNRFCPTCLVGFSGRRCPTAHSHAGGQGGDAIEIHVRGEGDSVRAFVDVMQIHGLYDCSEIQLETDLAPPSTLLRRLVPLHPPNDRAKEYCGSIRMGNGSLYCSMECEVQWRADKGAPGYQFVNALLAEDFTTRHQQDAFCTTCRIAFCTATCGDHADHPSVKIIAKDYGWLFVQVPAMEKWLGNFAFVPEGEKGYRLLPLTPPPAPGY